MRPTIRLVAMPDDTGFAPLGVLGYCLMRTSFLAPVLRAVSVPIKTVQHLPAAKLLDVLVSILAGCRAVSQVNTRLRPDLALAHAWGRPQFAAQATLARTLDSFSVPMCASCARAVRHSFVVKARSSATASPTTGSGWILI